MAEKKLLTETLQIAIANALANVHTSTVARVTAVNDTTISCRPVINRYVNGNNIELPEFIEVPPVFMYGGTSYTAHPIAIGDYCLLIFTERCFDAWYAGQDFVQPLEYRMHDYSDGFAFIGVRPSSSAITIPDVITQIGDTYEEGDYVHLGDTTQTGNYTQTGDYTLDGDIEQEGDKVQTGNLTITGNITINGVSGGGTMTASDITITVTNGDIICDNISLKNHTHGGVEPGGGSTGVPQ